MKLISFQNFCSRSVVTILKRYKSAGKSSENKMFVQKRNSLTGTTEWDVGVDHDVYDYHQEIARSAFADMLHDTERNKMYYGALRLAIEKMHKDGKKANVLDIGTGTGLLSMMAAKCGADTITACEAFKPMAECCLKILERNGFADKIKVIPKRSTEITVGEGGDMEQKANILVTEVFDTELIGEGALSTFSHAHKYLLEEDCIVVPDSAVIYALVVECPFLQRWNKMDDVVVPDLGLLLKTPQKMVECPGSAAVHDLQLAQVHPSLFKELSDTIPVFYYDWSGKSPVEKNRLVRQQFTALCSGSAQAVFMWWELNMDTEGRLVLSCAPRRAPAPAPWRDHWMQAVYYLPAETALTQDQPYTLVSCHDEYSLWFSLEAGGGAARSRPVCGCGLHVAWPRSHVARLNEAARGQRLGDLLAQQVTSDSVVLDLNGSSLLGLLAAKVAKKVYIHETSPFNINILEDYMKTNDITNVEFLADVEKEIGVLKTVTNVIFDPIRSSSLLPWEDLKSAYILHRCKEHLLDAPVIPRSFTLWALPVEFLDLHKIRMPVKTCEGFDVTIFDRLVERSRAVSDAALEPQPLWEYGARARGAARALLALRLHDPDSTHAARGSFTLTECSEAGEPSYTVNGFALWAAWDAGLEGSNGGPRGPVAPGLQLDWDPTTRQAVHILKKSRRVKCSESWNYRVSCDLAGGRFDIHVGFDA